MPETEFIVERLCWRFFDYRWLLLPGGDRIAAFADRDDADRFCREREWSIRRRFNPFQTGAPLLHYQSSFDPPRLHDWCLDAGMDSPGVTKDSRVWSRWWDTAHTKFTDLQRAAVWEALDRVRFFRVVEETGGEPCHLVSIPQETDYDIWSPPSERGSIPNMLTRTEVTADRTCHELYLHGLAGMGEYYPQSDSHDSWRRIERDPFAELDPGTAVPRAAENLYFAEHSPLPLVVRGRLHIGQTVYIVVRRHWHLTREPDRTWRWTRSRASSGRAVTAFDKQADADAMAKTLELRDRPIANLFRFGPPHEWSHMHPSEIWGMLSELEVINFTSLWRDYKATNSLWIRWWDEVSPDMTPEAIEMVWSLYDKLRFYEVVAVEYRE